MSSAFVATSAPDASRRGLLAAGAGLSAYLAATRGLAQPAAGEPKPTGATAKTAEPAPPLKLTLNAGQRGTLYKALREADQHGFSAEAFAPSDLGDALTGGDPDRLAKAQATLIDGVLRYARAQHGLRSFHGEDWPKEWALRPAAYDAEKELAFAVSQDKLADWLNGLPPPFARYRALKAALGQLRAQQATAAPSKHAAGAAKGAPVKRAPSAATGDGAPRASGAAVLSHAEQERALIANMERWRWMPRNTSPDRIEANAAAGLLQVYHNNQPTLAMKCAAGKKGDETPILTSAIDSIVFNPVWHIPKSIAAKEIIPKHKRSPSYFKSQGIVYSKESESGLIQKAGPKNALGQIKFDFKNAFSVYLHDTPAQSAFARTSRNVSHGCVRVEKPIDLAVLLLQGTPDGNPQAIQQAIAASDRPAPGQAAPAPSKPDDKADAPEIKTRRVDVPKPMPVFLLYWTAFPGDGGKIEFRKDVYGWDTRLLSLLSEGRGASKA